ncbi:MAG: DUF2207 domain-containing protein [Planctomycetes bacterium]|nr:DUF2207 domain-containing protein [Planctomycetota bacterium]
MDRCCDCMYCDEIDGTYRCKKTGETISTHALSLLKKCEYFIRRKADSVEVQVEHTYDSNDNNGNDDELRLKLRELEEEYRLARYGLSKGLVSVLSVMICFVVTMGMTIFGKWLSGDGILSGTHLVIIAVVLAFSVVIYFAFVFGRRSRLKAEISKTKAKIDMVAGDKAR